tara:strand:- start:108 stop:1310 length:1203 start_codon:yes stop_codon:yes gene_type:complete
MPYYKFKENDILVNRIKTYPSVNFFIYSGSIYYNHRPYRAGSFDNAVLHMTGADIAYGHPGISLYEMVVDRPADCMPYAFLEKHSSRNSFRTVSTGTFATNDWADIQKFHYPMTASISREFFAEDDLTRPHVTALKNVLDYYTKNSMHYAFSSSDGHPHARDFASAAVNLISIPSIFYGSSIKRGTIDLQFFVTGTLISRLQDLNKNGELIQTGPVGSVESGSVAGIALYKEGFFILTGSARLTSLTWENYKPGATAKNPAWIYFAATGSKTTSATSTKLPSSSFSLSFSGSNYVSTMTAYAHAPKMHLNYSANPTYIDYEHRTASADYDTTYYRDPEVLFKNTVSSSYPDPTASFLKQTFISKIGIYDENKNLIAIAKLANPVRKKEADSYTFKLKLDI